MTHSNTLNQILKEGEGFLVEFKESITHLDKEMCAFANARGGTIYVGVTDSGKVKSIHLTNTLKSQIQNLATSLEPAVKIKIEPFEGVIKITIFESEQKPVKAPQGFYMRMGANSQKLNRESIFRFAIKEHQIFFDTQLYIEEPATSLIHNRLVEKFREVAKLPDDLENLHLLENLGCLKWQNQTPYLTYAGILFFVDQPQRIFPSATLTLLLMENEADILKQEIIPGNLFNQLEQGFAFLKQHLVSRMRIESLQREPILEFPQQVLRELLINSLIHRDYFDRSADIVVKIFPASIEFSNPSPLPDHVSLNDLFGKSYRKNPVVADLFYRCGYIERAGTGLLRIKKTLDANKLKPIKLSLDGPFFIVTLARPVPEILGAKDLNDRHQQLLQFSSNFFPFSTNDYAERFGISSRMARRDIGKLIKQKIIKKGRKGTKIFYSLVK